MLPQEREICSKIVFVAASLTLSEGYVGAAEHWEQCGVLLVLYYSKVLALTRSSKLEEICWRKALVKLNVSCSLLLPRFCYLMPKLSFFCLQLSSLDSQYSLFGTLLNLPVQSVRLQTDLTFFCPA